MNKKTLNIKISGPVGSGKTTLAIFIRDALSIHGINDVSISDFDVENDCACEEFQGEKFLALKNRIIQIETVQQRAPIAI